jgi:hypothetical protein
MIVSGACILVAAGFFLLGQLDSAFVTAVIGMVAWFLNYRMQIKASLASADSEADESKGEDLDEDQ